MSDLELWEYFHHKIDMETVNVHHFALTHNEMIKRDLLKGDSIPLNANLENEMWGFDYEIS